MKLLSSEKQVEIQKGSLYPTLTFGYALGSNFINTRELWISQSHFSGDNTWKIIRISIGN